MILINGKEVIDDVRIKEDGTFETTVVSGRIGVSEKTKAIDKERFVDNLLPYVEIPSFVHVKNEKHETMQYCREEINRFGCSPICRKFDENIVKNLQIGALPLTLRAHYCIINEALCE